MKGSSICLPISLHSTSGHSLQLRNPTVIMVMMMNSIHSPNCHFLVNHGLSHANNQMTELKPGLPLNCRLFSNISERGICCTADRTNPLHHIPSMEEVVHVLQNCKTRKVFADANKVQYQMCHYGMESHVELGSHLVQAFVECGYIDYAERAFYRLSYQNEFSWTSLIQGYAEFGDSLQSFDIYEKMKESCVDASKFTFMYLLRACTKMQCVDKGREIHKEIFEKGFVNDVILNNSLVDMYIKCESLDEAREAFDKAPVRDVVTWNTLIAGYTDQNHDEQVLKCSLKMQSEGIPFDGLTFVSLVKSCRNLRDLERGRLLHAEIAKEGYEIDLFVSSSLVDMYSKCGSFHEAQDVFNELPFRDIVVWTNLIEAYTENGYDEEALICLNEMTHDNMAPNSYTYLCSLKACCNLRAIEKGKEIHSEVIKKGFERESFLSNSLVDMYAKCGLQEDAKNVFDSLVVKDVVSWSALLSGYAINGLGEEAFSSFQRMHLDGISMNTSTLVSSLKACSSLESVDKGRIIHVEVAQEGYEEDAIVATALMDMYAKCGYLEETQDVFDSLKDKDLVAWTTLMAGYAERGLGKESLSLLEKMIQEGLLPDEVTLVCSLKACICIGDLEKGQEFHTDIVNRGLETNSYIGNVLVDLYATYGTINEAKLMFQKLQMRDVISWNSLLSGLTEQNFHEEALYFFQQMQLEGEQPNPGTLICVLKSCGSIGVIERGQNIHKIIVENQFDTDLYVGNTVVDMYAKFGLLVEAREAFQELPIRDAFSWNALIGGYSDYGFGEESLIFLKQMQEEGVPVTPVTLISALKASSIVGKTENGHNIHMMIVNLGFDEDLFLGNGLVDMYAKCGSLLEAEHVFEKLLVRDSISWTLLIASYVENGKNQDALKFFENMQEESVCADTFTYICGLKACMNTSNVNKSCYIHMDIVRKGLDVNLIIGNTLLDTYAKYGFLEDLGMLFKLLPTQDLVSWTTLIAAYAEHGRDEEALYCLEQMKINDMSPDSVTYVCILKACISMGVVHKGRDLHLDIVKRGYDDDLFIANTLVYMYAKCNSIAEAQNVFDDIQNPDVVSWNALAAGYADAGFSDIALTCLEQMQSEGVSKDVVSWNTMISVYMEQGENAKAICTFLEMQEQGLFPDSMIYVNVLTACGNAAALDIGNLIHAQLFRHIYEGTDVVLSTAIIDMYSKCGSMEPASEVFEAIPTKDLIAWNSLLMGYARLGETEHVLCMFETMRTQGIKPDKVAFLTLLTVCCHAGLVDDALKFFDLMVNGCRIVPTLEHFNCFLDIFGRAGQLNQAVVMLKNMPFRPDSVVWSTMLAACQKWGDVELGKHAFEGAVSLDEENSAAFVLMSNLSADAKLIKDLIMEDG